MKNIESMLELLNEHSCKYVVLRNYEDLFLDKFLTMHPDIDFLCDDSRKLVSIIGAGPRTACDDGVHYAVTIRGSTVPVDVRQIGDGYYDKNWEAKILRDRTLYNENCFIPCKEDFYYSLLYHALVHKGKIAHDYMKKLNDLEEELKLGNNVDRLALLEEYMSQHGYRYEYPNDVGVGFSVRGKDRRLVKLNLVRKARRDFLALKQTMRRRLGGQKGVR